MPAQSFSGTIIITRGSSPTARRMTFACQVLRQNSFARSETMQRAVAQPDLDSAGERNHVLAARGVMPIDERQAPVKITSAAKVGYRPCEGNCTEHNGRYTSHQENPPITRKSGFDHLYAS
jgi:hypothetical protein